MEPGQQPSLLQKISAAIITGSLAITVACPLDLAKVRLQGQGLLPPNQRPYSSSFDVYRKTLSRQGVRGLWVGYGPNVARNSIMNATELASYDSYKQMAVGLGCPDLSMTHFMCAFLTGLTVVFVGSPVDVLKTRVMNKAAHGCTDCIPKMVRKMMKQEGPLSFYKGFTANFSR